MATDALGRFEVQVLLAVMRLGENAYGVPIADVIEDASAREINTGTIYINLDQLEERGFVTSRLGESTLERGGEARMYFHVTVKGCDAVRRAQRSPIRLWTRVPAVEGGTA